MVSGQGKISADQNVIYFCLGVSAVDFRVIGWGAGGVWRSQARVRVLWV